MACGNGEGSIYPIRKNGKIVGYRAAYYVYTAEGPKRRYLSGKRREDVRDKLTKAMSDRDGGLIFDAGALTVGDYLARWLSDSVRDTVRQRTYEGYEHMVERHITPTLGHMKLKALTPAHVRGLYRKKLDGNPDKKIKPLSPRTVQYVHTTLNKALKQATDDGLIPRNAAASVKAPRPKRKEIKPLNREQVRALFEAAAGHRLEALYTVAVTAGLREGELLALRWEDVDLEATTPMLQIRRTLSEARSGRIFEAPKSGKGRNIRLTRKAVEALRAHRKRQLEEKMEKAGLWQEQGLVFPSNAGTLLGARSLQRQFKATLERAGLSQTFRFHDLRHTCATLLLRQGVHAKYVQELLGHADISLTLNVYSHVLPDMGDAASGAMDDALG